MNHRIYQQIIDRLFDEEDMKALFLKEFDDLRHNPNLPPVPESIQSQDFANKLYYLFEETTDEKLIQVVLAPCLREKVYQYLASKDSPYQQSYRMFKGEEFLGLSTSRQRDRSGFSVQDLFIETIGKQAWDKNLQPSELRETIHREPEQTLQVSQETVVLAERLKHEFIRNYGLQEWRCIDDSPAYVKEYHALKDTFIAKYDPHIWESCCTNQPSTDIIYQDFLDSKQTFTERWENHIQEAWERARGFPLAEASLELLKQIKNQVAIAAGNQAWQRYLAYHRKNQTFVTDIQLTVLGEIFESSITVTIITNKIIKETMTLRDEGEYNHHFYCEDNNHWYVHANGYMKTIPDGNCGYNGFAQWFKFLVLGTEPDQLPSRADSLELTTHSLSPPTLFSPPINSEPNLGNESSRVSNPAKASLPETMNWFLIGLSFIGLFMLITSILLLLSMLVLALSTSFAQLGMILIRCGFESIAYQLVGAVGLNSSTAAVLAASIAFSLTAGLGATLLYDFAPAIGLDVTEPLLDNTRMSL